MRSQVANCRGRLIAVAAFAAILLALWLAVGPAFAQSTPEVSITSDGDVTEGADATFTLTASPAPASDLYVDVTVSEGPMSGMVTAPNQTGYYSVVIETGKTTATLAVATDDDKTDEPRGVIMAMLNAPGNSAGYTTASHAKYATVVVSDNDVATHDRGSSAGVTVTMSADHAEVWRQGGKTTLRFTLSRALKTGESITLPFTVQGGSPSVHYDLTNLQGTGVTRPSTHRLVLTTGATGATLDFYGRSANANSDRPITIAYGTGWVRPTASGIFGGIMLSGSPVTITVTRDQPATGTEITIDSVGPVREGEYSNFNVRANPAPANPITVNIGLTTRGDFGATGPSTVTISGETKGYYVKTTDDSWDEAHGSITATVLPGQGYAVGDPASATGVVRDNDDPGAGNPTVTISGGPAIDEGQSAAFTLTANPAATTANPITVNMGVSQTGQFNATGGWSVTITGATASYAIATTGDGVDEDHGSVTATILSGSGYDVGNPSSATVPVADDDGPAVNVWEREASVTEGGYARFHITTLRDPEEDVTVTLNVTATGDYGVVTGTRTVEFTTVSDVGLLEFNVGTTYDGVNEADGSITVSVQPGSDYTLGNRPTSTVVVKDFDVPEVNITAGPDVTEGQAATFNVTASPTPWQPLTVDLNVATVGNFGVTAGAQTVTVATDGTGTLSLNTSNDGVAETDGSVTATVQAGNGYTVGAASSASLAVADNDRPIVSLFAGVTNPQDNTNYGEITEGDPVTFTLRADNPTLGWSLNAPLPVKVKVETTGEFGVTAGTYTYTIPVGDPEAKTFTIPTDDDQIDDENGSVTLTVLPDSGYTVSSIKSILINVSDNDDPVVGAPEISIFAPSFSVQEGESLTLTITADTAPASAITVNIGAEVTGPADVTSPQTVTLSGTSATFSVSSAENAVSEADSTVGITVKPGDGYKVGETPYAWFRVKDDDQPVVSVGQGSVNQITEGGNAVFNLSLDRLPHQDLTVSLDITATGDFGVQTHTKTVAVKANQTRVNFSIPTTGDNVDEADGAVTATLKQHSSYRMAATARSASITVRDDDEPSGASLTVNVAEPWKTVPGGTLVFDVTLDKAVSHDVSVDYSLGHFGQKIIQYLDYSDEAGAWSGTVTIPAGKTATVVNVQISPDIQFDNHDRIYVTLSNPAGAKLERYYADGRIVDSLDTP